MQTEQEEFWYGDFGKAYTERNDASTMPSRIAFFAKILSKLPRIDSVYEMGANRGLNLDALKVLHPELATYGIEINDYAAGIASSQGHDLQQGSLLELPPHNICDLALVSGVLIHIHPDKLAQAYAFLFNASKRFILLSEYFSPEPVTIRYRGHDDRLFKRDFAKEMMHKYDLRLIDYGFIWKEDPNFPSDNGNWFLFEKQHENRA